MSQPSAQPGPLAKRAQLRAALEYAVFALLALGCSPPAEQKPVIRERPACPVCSGQAGSATPDPAPRKFYGVDAFVLDKCAQQRDGDITGTDCPGGFTVFGPYLDAPANSDVNFVFEVRPNVDATVIADVVSDVGRVVHAATPPLLVRAHERRSAGIRVHLFSHASKLEARVSVNAEQPINYTIHGLSLDVQ